MLPQGIYRVRQPLGSSQPTTRPLQAIIRNDNDNNYNNMAEPDYPVLLNNLLQQHPSGNLSPYFRYAFTQEGPDGDATHFATAMFHDQGYGVGKGRTRRDARQNAARATYELFSTNGVPGV